MRAKITYLMPLLSVKVLIPSEQKKAVVKIFGIPWKTKDAKQKQLDTYVGTKDSESNKKKNKSKKKKRKFHFVKDIAYYEQLWQENKELIIDVFRTVAHALATILPKDIEARIVYGTGMADVTGFIYALYCALESYLPSGVSVEPLWIEKHLEGEYKLRGKIRLFPLVIALFKIISNKNVKILYNKLRRV